MAKINIDVVAESGRAVSELRGLDGSLGRVQKTARTTGSVFKGVLGANLVGAGVGAAVAGLGKLTSGLGDAISEAREAQKVGRTTEAVIKATGGAAGVSADQIGALSEAISNKTGVDDEAVQQGANLLLTFKQIRNEAGQGANVFDRATTAAVDLSKAGFGSIDGASKMLGKALNDPIKGISALGRAGVTFTQQQKDQITQLTKTGDLLGAQKIILSEVESQVGGVAAANASAGEKAKVMADNLKEQFGTALLPLLDRAATFFTTTLGPAISSGIDQVGPVLDRLSAGLQGVFDLLVKGDFTGAFADAFGLEEDSAEVAGLFKIRDAVLQIGPAIQTALVPVMESVQTHAAAMGAALSSALGSLGGEGGPDLGARLKPIGEAIASLVAGASQVAQAVLPVLIQVGAAIGQAVTDNLPQIMAAGQAIGSTLTSIGEIISTVWSAIGPTVLPIVTSVFTTIIGVISGAVQVVSGVVGAISALLKGDLAGAGEAVGQIFEGLKGIVGAIFTNILTQAQTMAASLIKAVTGVEVDVDKAWADFPANVSKIWERIKSGVVQAAENLRSLAVAKVNQLRMQAIAAVVGLYTGVVGKVNQLKMQAVAAVVGMATGVVSRVTSMRNSAVAQVDGLRSRAVSAVVGMVSGIGSQVAQVPGKVGAGFRAAQSAAATALGALVSAVRGKIDEAVRFVAGLPGRAQSALSGMGGRLVSAGADLVRGFLNGMSGVIGSVAARAREMAQSAVNAARSALGIESPSKVFAELGKFVGQGLAQGVLGSRKDVDAAVKTLSTRMTAVFKRQADEAKVASVAARTASVKRWQAEVAEATKARAKIASNAKRYATLDAQTDKARAAVRANEARQAVLRRGGVTKAERAEYDRLRKANPGLNDRLSEAVRGKDAIIAENRALASNARALEQRAAKLKAAEAALAKARKVNTTDRAYARTQAELRQQQQLIKSLQVNAAARERIAATLDRERKQLTDLIKVRDDYDRSVRDSARGFASIVGIEAAGENVTLTSKTLAQGLRDRLNAITNFRARLVKLQALGINSSTYDQIVSAGVEGGMESLNAILAGGKTAVAEINALQSKINTESSKLGDTAADRLYKAGIDAQKGLIAGLAADEAALEKAASKFASKLTAAVKRELGIRSPSRVFEGIGDQTVAGLLRGLDPRAVALAGRDLARSVVAGYARPELAAPTVAGGRGLSGAPVTINVYASPLASPADIGREVDQALKAYARAGGR